MRSLASELAVLVLAVATATGAGNDINWVKSDVLPFPLPGDELPTNEDLETIIGRYRLGTKGGWLQDIREIEASFLSWEFFYFAFRDECAKAAMSEEEYNEEYDRTVADFNQMLCFSIEIRGKESMEARLQRGDFWEIYLEVGEDKIQPRQIKPLGVKYDVEVFRYTDPGKKSEASLLKEKAYFVLFGNPYGGTRPASLKLVLLGKKIRRGFEWRFKEE